MPKIQALALLFSLSVAPVLFAAQVELPKSGDSTGDSTGVPPDSVGDSVGDSAGDSSGDSSGDFRFDEVRGTLLLTGASVDEDTRERFARFAKGRQGELVIVTAASHRAGMIADSFFAGPWEGHFASIRVVNPRRPEDASKAPVLDILKQAKAIWFSDGLPERLKERFGVGSEAARVLRQRWREGAAIGAAGGAAIGLVDGRYGLALLGSRARFATLFQEDWEAEDEADPAPHRVRYRARVRARMLKRKQILEPGIREEFAAELRATPGGFGMRIGKGTILVRGRQLRVLEGQLELHLCDWTSPFAEPANTFGRGPFLRLETRGRADLEEWRRAALARAGSPEAIGPVGVRTDLRKGSVLVVGGGPMTPALWTRFLELAGGADAPILVVPTASGGMPRSTHPVVDTLEKLSARDAKVWHASTRAEAMDKDFCKPLETARGIWFSGGRQWRLLDRYEGTRAAKLFADVLRRGGVLAGTSAGCSVHAQCMVRGSPRSNRVMLAEGYERGFGFLAGLAIDQHFSQRKRMPDLEKVVAAYPRMTGLGVDEGTAALWKGSRCEVLGLGKVFVLEPGREVRVLEPGQSYDFAQR